MNKIYRILLVVPLVFISCKEKSKQVSAEQEGNYSVYDGHVHIMSHELIKDWKNLGIPFSKPERFYSDIDTILKINQADNINLIGMGYVYGSPEFYQGENEYQKLKYENDYLFEVSKKYRKKVKPFFSIDPLKEYAIKEIDRCLKLDVDWGLKLHFSSSQVYLTENEHLKKVKSIFKIAAENNLPILLHFDNWHPKFGKPDVEILVDSILVDLKPIKLTIAHFGTSGGFNQKTRNVIDTFVGLYRNDKISNRHTILFDISAVALDKDSEGVEKLTKSEFKELKSYCNKLGYNRITFGTDYPLYMSKEYIQVLENKLGLSKSEINHIVQNKGI
ncbi:amidohydrolase family protein [Aureibaculum conchae]|uniref:amidohydrolase family protein n=1 Tax=Aureibaculum sp. 2308TA14-22 TaxID=3108392 RepID=UPI0033938C5E